jgi:hypothetical protein
MTCLRNNPKWTGGLKTLARRVNSTRFLCLLSFSVTHMTVYVEFAKRCDILSFLRYLGPYFQYFGGIPDMVLTDQMKIVV